MPKIEHGTAQRIREGHNDLCEAPTGGEAQDREISRYCSERSTPFTDMGTKVTKTPTPAGDCKGSVTSVHASEQRGTGGETTERRKPTPRALEAEDFRPSQAEGAHEPRHRTRNSTGVREGFRPPSSPDGDPGSSESTSSDGRTREISRHRSERYAHLRIRAEK